MKFWLGIWAFALGLGWFITTLWALHLAGIVIDMDHARRAVDEELALCRQHKRASK